MSWQAGRLTSGQAIVLAHPHPVVSSIVISSIVNSSASGQTGKADRLFFPTAPFCQLVNRIIIFYRS